MMVVTSSNYPAPGLKAPCRTCCDQAIEQPGAPILQPILRPSVTRSAPGSHLRRAAVPVQG